MTLLIKQLNYIFRSGFSVLYTVIALKLSVLKTKIYYTILYPYEFGFKKWLIPFFKNWSKMRLKMLFFFILISYVFFYTCYLIFFISLLLRTDAIPVSSIADCISYWLSATQELRQQLLPTQAISSENLKSLIDAAIPAYKLLLRHAGFRFIWDTAWGYRHTLFNIIFQRESFRNLPLGEYIVKSDTFQSIDKFIALGQSLIKEGDKLLASL